MHRCMFIIGKLMQPAPTTYELGNHYKIKFYRRKVENFKSSKQFISILLLDKIIEAQS